MSSTSGVGTLLPWEWSNNPAGPAPYTYKVPGSLEVQPYTATAFFDGSGAAGAFYPTISIYSQAGALLARVFPSMSIAEGDSATVTWVPPFGSAASNPAPAPGGIATYALNFGIAPNMAPMTGVVQPFVGLSDAYFATDGGTYFEYASNAVGIKQAGMYYCGVSCYSCPTDAILGAFANGGSGSGNSAAGGGEGDILQALATTIDGFMQVYGASVGSQPEHQYAFGVFLVSSDDVEAGITLGPGLIVPTGWVAPAEHGANVVVWPAGAVPAGW